MSIRLLPSIAIFVFMMSSTSATSAPVDRDAELMTALQIIDARDGGWTAKDWQEFGYKVAKYGILTGVVVGAGAAAYYYLDPKGFKIKSVPLPLSSLTHVRELLAKHGGSLVFATAGGILLRHAMNLLAAMNNVGEAERLRTASTPDARVYRSQLRQFLRLKLSEQFLIARQDETLTDDLIRLARWIKAHPNRHVDESELIFVEAPAGPAAG